MRKILYTIYDKVAEQTLGAIIQEPGHAPAIRAFHDGLAAKQGPLYAHPADYELLAIGVIEENGTIHVDDGQWPFIVATGYQWLAAQDTHTGEQ